MATHPQNLTDDSDDALIHRLKSIDDNAANVRAEEMLTIREATRRDFLAVTGRTGRIEKSQSARQRRSPWFAVASMLASLVFSVWLLSDQAVKAEPTLGQALATLMDATTVSLEIHQPDGVSSVLFKAPGIVRWNDAEGHYRVADGHRMWSVDESTGDIEEGPSPLPVEGLTALSVLKLTEFDASSFRATRFVARETLDGVVCLVYEANVNVDHKPARLRAYASAETGVLTMLRLLQPDDQKPGFSKKPGFSPPLAEVRLVAINQAVPSDSFRVTRSLKDDGRTGAISETHGLVFVRAFPGHRWTPASPAMPLFIGDQIRCESRGANAAVLRLQFGDEITLGPAAVLEFGSDSVRLLNGDARVKPTVRRTGLQARSDSKQLPDGPGATSYVTAPDGSRFSITESTNLRATAESPSLRVLDTEPAWLKTLDENVSAETMGSLVAQVDGRDVSLTLGFHHVTVEIRDQIARTVIEESFVNNTDQRLEGQFHFPLPHDASVSGFGMWIGGKLVEADVVEKQRAREIYETILREKRDPGLLEWGGGNIFKARVFPIEAHGETRVRITYTQTLPLQNGAFRYNYALRSELLQKSPLRDLKVEFRNVQVAAVYPAELPNLPDGMQQILTGRFLPSETDAEARHFENAGLLKTLLRERIELLVQLHRADEALKLRREMVERWPNDLTALEALIQMLRGRRETDEVRDSVRAPVAVID